jgi:oligopeptidase B
VDFVGGETCQLFIKDLATGEIIDHDEKLEISGTVVWGDDDSTVFYLKMDDTHRPFQVYQRTIGGGENLLWEEPDALYWVHITKSLDGRYLFVDSSSKETSEVWYLDLKDPNAKLQCVAKRRTKVLYEVEHRKGTWWITSNVDGTPNMRLLSCPVASDCEGEWEDVVDGEGTPLFDGGYDRSLSDVTCFANHVVASGREGGIPRVWIISLGNADSVRLQSFQQLTFEEAAHDVGLSTNYEFETDSIVLSYDSLITPLQNLEIGLSDTSKRTVVKKRYVPGYEKSRYDCDRITVTARDGTDIPVSLVYRKDVMEKHLKEGEPVYTHLYGYGSYGACIEADFRATRLPLLDRGIVYVIAHVRGGGEMGRQWYEEPNGAKYLCKKNTFNDFCDVARWLIDSKKLTSPKLLSCEGRSAGGLLIGASINQAPELFKVAVLGVPFVDVVPTMIDASIPLTSTEWEEWGNPNEEKYHQYMMEYSPINNVQKGAKYPSCLLTGGLHDPRVQYWEPVKFAAELRHLQGKDSGPVCVKLDMTAGHFSASDRYKYLKELSFDYAFLLQEMGLVDEE